MGDVFDVTGHQSPTGEAKDVSLRNSERKRTKFNTWSAKRSPGGACGLNASRRVGARAKPRFARSLFEVLRYNLFQPQLESIYDNQNWKHKAH